MNNDIPQPPVAKRQPHTATYHGLELSDPYFWLKDQSYPKVDDEDVLAYLRAENSYYESVFEPLKPTVEELFQEIKGRQVEDDTSVAVRDGAFMYQSRFVPDKEYRQRVRWYVEKASESVHTPDEQHVQVLIDENTLATGHDYFRLGSLTVSPDQTLLSFSTDTTGSERYKLQFKDLETGEIQSEVMENVADAVVFAADGKSLFYTIVDDEWRPYRVYHHILGTPVATDRIVYEEQDAGFFVSIDQTTSRRYLVIESASNVTSEVRVLSLDSPEQKPILVSARKDDHLYSVDHHRDRFIILTNDKHKNFRLAAAPENTPQMEHWQALVNGSDSTYLTAVLPFEDQVVVEARVNGQQQILLLRDNSVLEMLDFDEAVYTVSLGDNRETNPEFVRLVYSSPVTPQTTYDYHFESKAMVVRKVQQIPSGYDRSSYVTERRFAMVRDGTMVPVTIAYRKGTALDGSAPLYLYGYGAYGSAVDPNFRTTVLSLLDRGFIYAIAHIRGGDELGYHWYEAGKLDRRTNTFNDFVDVARHLVEQEIASAGNIAIAGGSAGGSLVGAALNQAPSLWGVVVAHVPFVDILNTMLDETLPLTPIEWPEWGNPIKDKQAFEYIRSYSPYDQLRPIAYPPILVTAGLNDPRVTYWEPAKWVAKLRHLKQDDSLLVLRTEMGAGHGGKSGRYESLKEVAEEYAFILHVLSEQGKN